MIMSHHQHKQTTTQSDWSALAKQIKDWGGQLGFQQTAITDTDLSDYEPHLQQWLAKQFQGDMEWMARHGNKRSRPSDLVPDTLRIISVRLDYLPDESIDLKDLLDHPEKAYISRYALGRDYHKLMRRRLQQLAERIQNEIGRFGYRAFVDSAPVMEKALGEKPAWGG